MLHRSHPDPDSLPVAAELLQVLGRQVHWLHLTDPALARRVRAAGTAIARSVAAARLAPHAGHAARHRQRARESALALIDDLQRALDEGWFLLTGRHQAQALAVRLIHLLDAGY